MNNLLKLSAFMLVISLSSCGYNAMTEKQIEVDKSWANVESQYQRRADLIGNLVETVKGAANFEKETFTAITKARSGIQETPPSQDMLKDEQALNNFYEKQNEVLSSARMLLNFTYENYPELKATESFRDLQTQLEGTENRINRARDLYNESVKNYNTYIKQFPRVIYAGWFDFEPKEFFKADPGSSKAPEVKF